MEDRAWREKVMNGDGERKVKQRRIVPGGKKVIRVKRKEREGGK